MSISLLDGSELKRCLPEWAALAAQDDEREEDEANRAADEARKKQRAERRQKHEEAKLEHERSVGAMQEVVTKLQGDKSKLFQLLKQ